MPPTVARDRNAISLQLRLSGRVSLPNLLAESSDPPEIDSFREPDDCEQIEKGPVDAVY
jgi:hypothetical protein